MPRIAAASIGDLAAVGLGIALMVRADPTPTVAHAGPAVTASAATPAASAAPVERPHSTAAPPAVPEVVASTAPSASASTHELTTKAVATVHTAPAAAEKQERPKPKTAASAKGFDLGY
jgi:hypothetical protein